MMFMDAKRLIFLLPFHHDGGVEVWMKNIIYAFPDMEKLIIIHGPITQSIESDIPNCHLVNISDSLLELNKIFKKYNINKYDLVISALTPSNLKAVILRFVYKYKLITSLHISIQQQKHENFLKFVIRKYLYIFFYYFSDKLLTVSKGLQKELFKNNKKDLISVYNPIVSKEYIYKEKVSIKDRENIVLGCGRLEFQKGFDRLIKACALVKKKHNISFKLNIIGDGSLKNDLLELAINEGIDDIVTIVPFTKEVFKYYEESKVFVLSSHYEGFGNVLAEAMVANCYCISFDIPHGPKEILNNGKYGVLVKNNDVEKLSEEIYLALKYDNIMFSDSYTMYQYLEKFTIDNFKKEFKKINLI